MGTVTWRDGCKSVLSLLRVRAYNLISLANLTAILPPACKSSTRDQTWWLVLHWRMHEISQLSPFFWTEKQQIMLPCGVTTQHRESATFAVQQKLGNGSTWFYWCHMSSLLHILYSLNQRPRYMMKESRVRRCLQKIATLELTCPYTNAQFYQWTLSTFNREN